MTTSPTSSLVEAMATVIGGYMASADRAHGYHIEAARAALSAIEQQGFVVLGKFDSTGREIRRDPSMFGDVETALDCAGVPSIIDGKWLTLVERIELLAARPKVT